MEVSKPQASRKLTQFIPAMLAKESSKSFSDDNWLYEIKWDGYRAIAELNNKEVKLYSRNGLSFESAYPAVFEALQKMQLNAVLDGEIVVMNEEGRPDFQKLQHYADNTNFPIVYYVFDLLQINNKDLYKVPLIERKKQLQQLIGDNDFVKFSDHVVGQGDSFFEVAKEKDLEGIMAKKSDSLYYPGKRTNEWLKIKHHKSEEAIIAGFTAPRGGRKYFGALVLGVKKDGKLLYAGHTGSGFNEQTLKDVNDKLIPIIQPESPFDERIKTNMPVTWVKPQYVCELKFTEWTRDRKMRHPIFLRLREDKKPDEVVLNQIEAPGMKAPKKAIKKTSGAQESAAASTDKKSKPDVVANEKEKTYVIGKTSVKTTNRTKIFFPDNGITKGDIIDYYDRIADYILPYLKDRPESLFRTPNGINQQGFFQKNAGEEAPAWVKSIEIESGAGATSKQIDYLLCNSKATLLYMANLGCIEINPWHSTTKKLDYPDYLIIDIDPSDKNTFEHVIEAANATKEVLNNAGVVSFCKTSGSSGLHVYVPTGKKYTYEQVKDFAYLVCMLVNEKLPKITTLERSLSKRSKSQIYMDYLQNRRGQTIASVYSVRPKPGATVSTPLQWDEVKKGLHPSAFTIHTIEQRLKEKGDLFAGLLTQSIDLNSCLEKLS